MAQLEMSTASAADGVIVTLAGECDLSSREDLTAVLLDAVRDTRHVVVDLAELAFIDSTGIHALVVAYHAAKETGGTLNVRNAQGRGATVLDITGVAVLLAPDGGRCG